MRDRRGAAEDPGRSRASTGRAPTIIGGSVGEPAIGDDAGAPTRIVPISVYGEFDLADEVVRRDMEEPVAARAPGRQRAIEPSGRNPYDERSKTHAGSANSASIGASGSRRGPSDEPVQVPPAAAIADEMEDAVGRPFGLRDRLVEAACGEVARTERSVVPDRGDPQPRGVPGHVRVVPLEPGEPRRRPGDRRGAARKSGPSYEDPRRTLPVERHVDDRGRRLDPRLRGPRARRGTAAGRRRSAGRRSGTGPRA